MVSKTAVCVFTAIGFIVITVYLAKFKHPPPAAVLAANKRGGKEQTIAKLHVPGDPDYDPYEEAETLWENFIISNGYVAIGSIYDSCDESDRFKVGKVILTPDTLFGGVMSRIFLNISLDEDFTDGTFFIAVQYNGVDLYENNFQICNKDANVPDSRRLVACPISAGYKSFDRDMKVPNYIPKGHYTVKARATNSKDKTIACGFADFVL